MWIRRESAIGQVDAENKWNRHVQVEKLIEVKLPQEKSHSHVGRQEQKEQALDQRGPTDEGNNHRQCAARPDIVRENHRQSSTQGEHAKHKHHLWVVKKCFYSLHDGLSMSDHGECDENAVQPD